MTFKHFVQKVSAVAAVVLIVSTSVIGASAGSAQAAKPRPPRPTPTAVPTATPAPTVIPSAPPSAPVLRLQSVTTTQVNIVWDPSVDSVTGVAPSFLYQYIVYVNGVLRGISDTCAYCFGTTTTSVPLPPPGQSVRVTVVASVPNVTGIVSPPSNEFVYTSPGSTTAAPPTAPVLRLAGVTGTSVSIVWDSSVNSATGIPQLYLYRYFVNGVPQGSSDTCAYCIGSTSVTVPRPAPGQSVRVTVLAVDQTNANLVSPLSNELVYTAP